MAKWPVIAFVLLLLISPTIAAQGASKSAQAGPSLDPGVEHAYATAKAHQPSAADAGKTSAPGSSASTSPTSSPPTTLDDYYQERWKIKLGTLVPVLLLATPIILLIVLAALRFGGIRSPEHIMLAAALVLVIQATLIVSLTAEGSDALSASMGILGAIAGYLFGRSRQEAQPSAPAVKREAGA